MSELLNALEQDRAVVAGEAERPVAGVKRKPAVAAGPRKKAVARRGAGGKGKNDPGETAAEDCERIVQKSPCGWCTDGLHDSCMIETNPWYGKIWICGCKDEGCLASRGREGDTVGEDAAVSDGAEPEGITSYEQHPGDEGVLDSGR